MVFFADDMNDKLFHGGEARDADDDKAVYYGTGECQKIRQKKNGCTGYFIHSGVQGGKTVKFQCCSQISDQTHQHDAADEIPNPSGENAPQDGK